MHTPLPAAVLWDMDGTLVDTEPDWIATERALVISHGGTWTDEDSERLVGSALIEAGEYIRVRGGLPMTAEQVVETMVERVLERLKESVTWRPGARELLADLRAHHVPCALVTMSYRKLADVVVSALPPDSFGAVVTGDEVVNGKPHPEPYLRAARELGVDIARCIVIEDSTTGARAGVASGARVVAAPNVVDVNLSGVPTVATLVKMRAADLAAIAGYRGAPR
ncbi:MAG TPA: HAD family phosphatase [Jiangellaceae bacterium]|nr:HAD family phosphatase [Jiangellaceae bacterium]